MKYYYLVLLTIIFDYGLSYLKPDPKVRTFEVENFREQIVVRLMSHPPNSIKYRKSNYIDELRYLKIDDNGFIVPSVRHKKPDKTIVIESGAADSSAADGAGISIDGASATILY